MTCLDQARGPVPIVSAGVTTAIPLEAVTGAMARACGLPLAATSRGPSSRDIAWQPAEALAA